MYCTTFRTLTIHALVRSVSAFALALSIPQIAFAQAVSVPLSSLGGSGISLTIAESPPTIPQLPELLTISITGAVFPAGFTGEVDLLDLGANGQLQLSDRILFDNGGPNAPAPVATINFLSDDEQGNLPPGFLPPYPLLIPPMPETAPAVITIPIIDLFTSLAFPLTATMISDLDPPGTNLPPNLSDAIHLQIPEPSTIGMAGIGLLALAAIAARRSRLARSR